MLTTTESGIIVITSHAVCTPIVEIKQDGHVMLSRMSYTKEGRTTIRHIMETGESGETVKQTLEVGLPHEAAKDAAKFSFKLLECSPVMFEFGPDRNNVGGTHMKLVMPVIVTGNLRDFDLPDGDEVLGPITMVEAGELLRETDGKTIPFHVRATKSVIVQLAGNHKVFERYKSVILGFTPRNITSSEKSAMEVYPGRWRY